VALSHNFLFNFKKGKQPDIKWATNYEQDGKEENETHRT
jgi:hypothetical protein